MQTIPSITPIVSAIAGEATSSDVSSGTTFDGYLRTGLPKKFSNAKVEPWSVLAVSYAVGDRVSYEGYVYVCIQAHESINTKTPGTSGGSSYWTNVGSFESAAHNYLLRADLNAFLLALSKFWYAMQNGGMANFSFDKTISSQTTGFAKGTVRLANNVNSGLNYNEIYFVESKKNDNQTAPNPTKLIHEYISGETEDPNWTRLTPSLKNTGNRTDKVWLKYCPNGVSPSTTADNRYVYAVPGAWGAGYFYEDYITRLTSVYYDSSPISEAWYYDSSLGLKQVFGWKNHVNQKIVGDGVTSGTQAVSLLRGRYNIIVIGKGGGPYVGLHPCAHFYGNPGQGSAGFAGTVSLEHGIYTIKVDDESSDFSFNGTKLISAQAGGLSYNITTHTTNPQGKQFILPIPTLSVDKLTVISSVQKDGENGKNNGMMSSFQYTEGTGGNAPLGDTYFGVDCSIYGCGSSGSGGKWKPNTGSQVVDNTVITRPAGSGFVYLEYAGPYDGMPT